MVSGLRSASTVLRIVPRWPVMESRLRCWPAVWMCRTRQGTPVCSIESPVMGWWSVNTRLGCGPLDIDFDPEPVGGRPFRCDRGGRGGRA